MSATNSDNKTPWLDRVLVPSLNLNVEKTLYLILILLAIFSRFWLLGERAMSHDESLHTYYSWNLYQGAGFNHTPLMHGPLKFVANAAIYSVFGADDFTARILAAVFGVALVALPYTLRRWMGRSGALITAVLILISPSLWYHGRYIRDEALMLVWIMLMAWSFFAYLHDRRPRWLLLLTIVLALAFLSMEATFLFVAIFGFFLIAALLVEMSHREDFWVGVVGRFTLGVVGAIVIMLVAIVAWALLLGATGLGPGDPSPFPAPPQPLQPGQPVESSAQLQYTLGMVGGVLRIGVSMLVPAILIGVAIFFWMRFAWPKAARESRVFDLVIVLGTMSLFMLSASVLNIMNSIWKQFYGLPFVDAVFFEGGNFPTTDVGLVLRLTVVAFTFIAAAVAIGLWWNRRTWLLLIGSFLGLTITFFTTIFTNGVGLGTGFVGSLGYWMVQQGVQRGTQPIYYYLVVTPIYEYLPMLIAAVASVAYIVRGVRHLRARGLVQPLDQRLFIPFVFVWMIGSWAAFSYAGEKMPWLMVYLALPMTVMSGRYLGEKFETIDWGAVARERQWLAGLLAAGAIVAGAWALGHTSKALSGQQLDSLATFASWISAVAVLVICVGLLWRMRPAWRSVVRMLSLLALLVLMVLTVRTGWIWNFINYDSALEFGVYAHAGPGVKEALAQIEELSQRTTGGKTIRIGFDADASWPYYWYLRDYPNKFQYSNSPSRTDLDAPLLLASGATWNTVDAATKKTHTYWQGHRIWWPMEDYKVFADCPASEVIAATGATNNIAAFDENADGAIDESEKARGAQRCTTYSIRKLPEYVGTVATWLLDGQRRSALMDIFLNRNFTAYDQIRGGSHKPEAWPLVDDFRLYVSKNIGNQIWTEAIGSGAAISETVFDPYAANWRDVTAIVSWGTMGSAPGQFQSPHGVSVAPDGSIYVADGGNHRVQKFDADGQFVASIGTPSGGAENAPGGQFNEPWDVAVAPDGSIYVADTWNHRIQHFSADGEFLNQWGTLAADTGGQAVGFEGQFYGPRGVAVGPDGKVYVADTGNKRVQIFDKDGKFLSQFGGGGFDLGRLDEPVGIAVDAKGNIAVVDTWNARIQTFNLNGVTIATWEITGWLDKEAVGKPYLAFDGESNVYVSDEAGKRILIFNLGGKYLGAFGQYGTDNTGFVLPGGIDVDDDGLIYVVDTGLGRVLKYPAFEIAEP